jgi:hypothetical protein
VQLFLKIEKYSQSTFCITQSVGGYRVRRAVEAQQQVNDGAAL